MIKKAIKKKKGGRKMPSRRFCGEGFKKVQVRGDFSKKGLKQGEGMPMQQPRRQPTRSSEEGRIKNFTPVSKKKET